MYELSIAVFCEREEIKANKWRTLEFTFRFTGSYDTIVQASNAGLKFSNDLRYERYKITQIDMTISKRRE